MKLAKTDRPVNLDISTIQLPITSYASILHRASGVVSFLLLAVLLWMLDLSLESKESFDALAETLGNPLVKLILWGLLAALAYHFVAGVRHLLMDMGIGEDLEGGVLGAKVVFAVSAVLILLVGVVVW